MLHRKKKQVKEVKRIQRRKAKILYQKIAFTAFLSCLSVICAYFLSSQYVLISPMPEVAGTTNSSVTKLLEAELAKQQIKVTHIHEEGEVIRITLEKNQEVILASSQDFRSELASLQLIMRQLTMEGKRFERVDLRFDKPVIVYAK